MKKKTHNEYVTELAIKNPNVEVIGQYINTKTKIMHHCLIHNIYWYTTPSRVLKGCGCEMCRKDKFYNIRAKTHEEYVVELKKINQNIDVVEKYIDMNTPILHLCKKHNIIWKTTPSNIIYQKCGCVKCGNEKVSEKNSKTHEQYVAELKKINQNIEAIDVYLGANIPILHKCLIDWYEWKTTPANTLSGKGCPKCAGNVKKTHKEYIKEVSFINSNIEVVGEYINSNTPILHRCKIHNILWNAYPSWILKGCGCKYCGIEKSSNSNRKTNEQYIEELKQINPNIIVLEEYANANTPILHKCLVDGYEWKARPCNILFGTGCPKCNSSRGERIIQNYLDEYNIQYITQKSFDNCRDIKPLPFDFYLPTLNIAIEYQGKQHYEPIEYFGGQEQFEYIQKHDNMKNEYCKNNGISLLRIPYYKNVEEELNNFLFI